MRQLVLSLAVLCVLLPAQAAASRLAVDTDGVAFRLTLSPPAPRSTTAVARCFERTIDGRVVSARSTAPVLAGARGASVRVPPPVPGAVPVVCRVSVAGTPAVPLAFGPSRFAAAVAPLRAAGLYAFLAAPAGAAHDAVAGLRRALPGQRVALATTVHEARRPGTLYVLERASSRGTLALALPLGGAVLLVRGASGREPTTVKVVPRGVVRIGTALTITGHTDEHGKPVVDSETESP